MSQCFDAGVLFPEVSVSAVSFQTEAGRTGWFKRHVTHWTPNSIQPQPERNEPMSFCGSSPWKPFGSTSVSGTLSDRSMCSDAAPRRGARGSIDLCSPLIYDYSLRLGQVTAVPLPINLPASTFPFAYYRISIKDDVALANSSSLPRSLFLLQMATETRSPLIPPPVTHALFWLGLCVCVCVFPCRIVASFPKHASNDQDKDHGAQPSPHVRPVWRIFHRRNHHHRMSSLM